MHRHLIRTAIGALVVLLLGAGAFSFVRGDDPVAAIQRVWRRVVINPEPVLSGDTVLDVRFDAQDHALSCEVASLKMALAYRGVSVEESVLLDAVGTDPTPKQQTAAGTVWGDPHRAFVGNVDGAMLVDGYGVYWEPIARAGAAYRKTRAFTGGTASLVARAIADGDPVILWGFLGSGQRFSWRTPEGRRIPAVLYEHVYVAYGFRGSAEEPAGFFLMDPIYGSRYLDTEEFLRVWSALDYPGVIIY